MFVLIFAGCNRTATPEPAVEIAQLSIGAADAGITGATTTGIRQPSLALSQEGLTLLSIDGRVLPRLAEQWAWAPDDRSLVVTLRPGVTFHDGTQMSAGKVAEILQTAVKRPGNLAQYPALTSITGVAARGDREVVLSVSRRSTFLPEDLELPITLPNNIGTGAFRIVKNDPTEIVLDRFEQHYSGTPAIRRVVITPFQTLRTAWTSLLRNEIDMVTNVPPEAVEFVSTDDVQVVRYARRFQFLIGFNSRRGPLANPMVRRALNLAVDRADLIERVLGGNATPATGPLWPQHWAYDRSARAYGFEPALAMSLLDQAGLPARTVSQGPATRLTFTCLLPANFTLVERLALEIQKQLYNVGVDMRFEVVPPAEFGARMDKGAFDAALLDMNSGPTLGRPYVYWRSARSFQGLNVFGYENPNAERLFQDISDATNEGAIRSATGRLQQVFMDDPPALFLLWNEGARAVRRDFQIVQDPGRDPLFSIARWTSASGATESR